MNLKLVQRDVDRGLSDFAFASGSSRMRRVENRMVDDRVRRRFENICEGGMLKGRPS